jgi:hypothetical protein
MLEAEKMFMEFRRPQKSWTAVVRGAVICGIEKMDNPSLRLTNPCRHSYAFCQDEIYSATHHSDEDAIQIGGKTYAQSQLDWLLNKGDLILDHVPTIKEKTFDLRINRFRQDSLRLPIWRNLSDEKNRPIRYEDASDGQ